MGETENVSTRVLTIPNLISFARLGLIPVFMWAFISRHDLAALILMFFIGMSDFVDGYIARRFGQVSELGKLLDPLSDRVAIFAAMVALTVRGIVPLALALVIMVRDGIVAIAFAVLERRGYPRIAVNSVGKAATLAIFLGMGFALIPVAVDPFEDAARLLSLVFLILGAALYWVAGALYVVEIRKVAHMKSEK